MFFYRRILYQIYRRNYQISNRNNLENNLNFYYRISSIYIKKHQKASKNIKSEVIWRQLLLVDVKWLWLTIIDVNWYQLTSIVVNWRGFKLMLASIFVNSRQFSSKIFSRFFEILKIVNKRHKTSKNVWPSKKIMSDASSQLSSIDVNHDQKWRMASCWRSSTWRQ